MFASTAAGKRLAGAVPEVQTTATGLPELFANPSAKKPAERSSSMGSVSNPLHASQARIKGVDREPGEKTTYRTPMAKSVRAKVVPQA